MQVVFISGAAACGKTTVGRKVATRLNYKFLSKDTHKERLFDNANHTTYDFWWYEKKSKDAFFKELGRHLRSGNSVVVESNFTKNDRKRLNKLISRAPTAEVYCYSRGLTHFKRFVRRNESAHRHPGHHDRMWYVFTFFNALLSSVGIRWKYPPLKLSEKIIKVDTTSFSEIDYQEIVSFLNG